MPACWFQGCNPGPSVAVRKLAIVPSWRLSYCRCSWTTAPMVSVSQPPLCGTHSHLAFATLPLPIPSVAFLKPTASSRLSAALSGSPKCLRFGLWLTLCTLNIDLLTYLLTFHRELSMCLYTFATWLHIVTRFLGGVVVRASDLWSKDREFDSRPEHCRVAWVNSAFHPSGVGKSSTCLRAGVMAGRVHLYRVAGNTVIRYDIWHRIALSWEYRELPFMPLNFWPRCLVTTTFSHVSVGTWAGRYRKETRTTSRVPGMIVISWFPSN